jgi:RHS repeat-associated protein
VWRAAYYRGTKYNAAAVTQRTQYYPSGLPWSESLNPDIQKRKYNGKEFVETNGYDMYDYEARGMYPAIMRFTTVDPMAEKYYSISPYAYCGGNPVNAVDPDGMSMYSHNDVYNVDTSSKRVYVTKTDDPYDIVLVNGQNSVILPKGQVSENYYENLGYSVWPANPVGMEMTDLGLSLFMSEIAFAKASPYFGKLLTWLIGKPSITKASLWKVANELEKSGLSKVGRALKKHSDRIGSAFPKAVGNQGAINAQAEKVLKDILGNPSVTVTRRNARSVGEVLDYRIPCGILVQDFLLMEKIL